MRKSLPLIAGAALVPLLAATVAAFAVSSPEQAPAGTLPTTSVTSSATVEAPTTDPVQLATPPSVASARTVEQAPALQAADEPDPTTVTTTPTQAPAGQVPSPLGPTVDPTTPPLNSPIAPEPIEMTISWDGLKCARDDAWIVDTVGGQKMMCPGSRNP